MILEELFGNVAIFRNYIPFLDANVAFNELESSARSARKQICVIITQAVYNEIIKSNALECFESLRTAMANLTLEKQVVFDAINHRKQEVDIYRYEQEAMRRSYRENYYNAMDTLIQDLEASEMQAWKESRFQKMLSTLKIKTATDFDELYPIDGSYLFFFRIIPFQREALDDFMAGYYERVPQDGDNTVLLRKLDRCLAMFTIARSLRQFDILELPSTIRNLFQENTTSRNGANEQDRVLKLSEQLMNEAQQFLRDIDNIMSNSEGGNVSTEENYSQPDDKFYVMI